MSSLVELNNFGTLKAKDPVPKEIVLTLCDVNSPLFLKL